MRFEARELKPYGEFVAAPDLREGVVYFRVSFLDHEMLVPEMVPLVFIGRVVEEEGGRLYFQDAASYFAGERLDLKDLGTSVESSGNRPHGFEVAQSPRFETIREQEFSIVFDFEKGLDQLLACSLRRQRSTRP